MGRASHVSRWRSERLYAPFPACVMALQICACQDLAMADESAPDTPPTTQSIDSTGTGNQGEPPDNALRGACSEADRVEYVHDPNPEFISKVRACSRETWANKVKNIACLKKAMPSLSSGCAACFANMASCSLENCAMPCLFGWLSDICVNCANANCQEALVKCTGVARADLP